MTPIVDFYQGIQPDYRGRWLRDIWRWDAVRLEMAHDYIQILFPNRDQSLFNVRASLLDDATVAAFHQDERLRNNLATSLRVMLRFYGLETDSDSGKIVRADDFEEMARNWLNPYNHNYRRITRILKCLMELGLPERARAFLDCLERIRADHPGEIEAEAVAYWRDAVRPAAVAEPSPPRLPLHLLAETFAVCRLPPSAPFPEWAAGAELISFTRTPRELSVLCPQSAVPDGVRREGGWRCLQVEGTIDFSAVGILDALLAPLARAGIGIFALSTFDTDYVMVKEENLARALAVLEESGHEVRRYESNP